MCKYSGKCEEKQQYKAIIEAEMVSTPEGFTDNSPIPTSQSTTVKKPNTRKLLCQFL